MELHNQTTDKNRRVAVIVAGILIPPRKGAAIRPPPGRPDVPPTRGAAVARIVEIGRKAWKKETHYHRRSLAETAMGRYKTIIGPSLRARTLNNQKAEAAIGAR